VRIPKINRAVSSAKSSAIQQHCQKTDTELCHQKPGAGR
jgi:hypothetical protein